jgi:hypothetical protein
VHFLVARSRLDSIGACIQLGLRVSGSSMRAGALKLHAIVKKQAPKSTAVPVQPIFR